MDSIATLQRSAQGAEAMIRGVGADELKSATPCTEWDVRALINHMAGTCAMFTAALEGSKGEMPTQERDLLGSEPASSFAAILQKMLEAWRKPGALERTLATPIGEIPGQVGIKLVFMDLLLHTWDLAQAVGRSHTIDADLAEVSLQTMQQMVRPEFRGPGKGFAEAVPWPEDAPVQERLLAFSGRRP